MPILKSKNSINRIVEDSVGWGALITLALGLVILLTIMMMFSQVDLSQAIV